MSTKTPKMKTKASAEDRRRVQGIGDKNVSGSSSKTGRVYWQEQGSVNIPFYRVANSNTVSYLSHCCLVLILFSSDSFLFFHWKKDYQYWNHVENYFVTSVHQPCVCTPYVQESKKLRVIIINRNQRNSLATKNRNEIIIWIWNKPVGKLWNCVCQYNFLTIMFYILDYTLQLLVSIVIPFLY